MIRSKYSFHDFSAKHTPSATLRQFSLLRPQNEFRLYFYYRCSLLKFTVTHINSFLHLIQQKYHYFVGIIILSSFSTFNILRLSFTLFLFYFLFCWGGGYFWFLFTILMCYLQPFLMSLMMNIINCDINLFFISSYVISFELSYLKHPSVIPINDDFKSHCWNTYICNLDLSLRELA